MYLFKIPILKKPFKTCIMASNQNQGGSEKGRQRGGENSGGSRGGNNSSGNSNRGLASADKETRERVSREGGKASHGGGRN
jgi:hypothetical protein